MLLSPRKCQGFLGDQCQELRTRPDTFLLKRPYWRNKPVMATRAQSLNPLAPKKEETCSVSIPNWDVEGDHPEGKKQNQL